MVLFPLPLLHIHDICLSHSIAPCIAVSCSRGLPPVFDVCSLSRAFLLPRRSSPPLFLDCVTYSPVPPAYTSPISALFSRRRLLFIVHLYTTVYSFFPSFFTSAPITLRPTSTLPTGSARLVNSLHGSIRYARYTPLPRNPYCPRRMARRDT